MKWRAANSSIPLLSGLLMATGFMAGAVAYELGRSVPGIAPPQLMADSTSLPRPVEAVWTTGDAIPEPVMPFKPDNLPIIALIIDDAGIDPDLTRRAMALGIPLTLSFLPYAETSADLAIDAGEYGHDVFLHLPMEPVGFADPGPGALTRHLGEEEIAHRTRMAFAAVPGAIGLNNHMGSAFTADETAMRAALSALQGQDLIFVDSLTSNQSRAHAVAQSLGYVSLRRHVFIDHDAHGLDRALDDMAERARETGAVIAIGHPRERTLERLEAWLADPENKDVRFVTISAYLEAIATPQVTASNETVSLLSRPE